MRSLLRNRFKGPTILSTTTTTVLKCLNERSGRALEAYGVGGELDGRRVLAAADAAVALHLTAEQLPATVQLRVGPVALCLWGDGGHGEPQSTSQPQ